MMRLRAPHRRTLLRSIAALVVTLFSSTVVATASVESGFGVAARGGLASGEESYKTDLFTGAATTSTPIIVPAGSNGFEPQIALTYNSQRGITWVGRGWDLSLPSISRMTKFGTPTYSDDPTTGDRFALNDDRLVRDDAGLYRSMRDSFTRIEFKTGVCSPGGVTSCWVLRTTDGVTQWFGSTPDSQIKNPENDKVFRWLLSRAEDANGNYIRYEYTTPTETGDDGSAYPKRISYSFAGDESPTSPTARSISFTLNAANAPRSDTTIIYTGGFRTEKSKRLETITVKLGSQLVTRYDLVYTDEDNSVSDPINAASLLRRLVRTGANDTSQLPADTYTYSGTAPPSWVENTAFKDRLGQLTAGNGYYTEQFDLTNGRWRLMEVNGDGVPDVVVQSTMIMVGSALVYGRGVFLNMREEPLFDWYRTGAYALPVAPYPVPPSDVGDHETVFGATTIYNVPGYGPNYTLLSFPLWADFTGDGRIDILNGVRIVDYFVDNYSIGYVNNGVGWPVANGGYSNPPVPPVVAKAECVLTPRWVRGRSVLADVNGDGLADLLYHAAPDNATCDQVGNRSNWTERRVYLNTGSGWQNTPDPAWSAALGAMLDAHNAYLDDIVFFDLNGDGLVDAAEDSNDDGEIDGNNVRVNTGTRWSDDSADDLGFDVPSNLSPVDLNGDGFVDDAHWGSGARLGTGADFSSSAYNVPGLGGAGRAMVDLDGDGLVDLVRGNGDPSEAEVRIASASTPPDLLISVTRATGGTVGITYVPSSAGNCADAELGGCHALSPGDPGFDGFLFANSYCGPPMVIWSPGICLLWKEHLPFVVQTAVATSVDDLNGTPRTDATHYDLGFFDPVQREFRGFAFVAEQSQPLSYANPTGGGTTNAGTIRITEFYQLDFLRGAPSQVTLFESPDGNFMTPDEVPIEQTWNHYAVTRGDASSTLLLQVNDATISCDPGIADVENPEARAYCAFTNLDTDPYVTGISVPAPHPYSLFRDEFCGAADPTNRDCSFAYLVLPVGTATRRFDASTPVDLLTMRWFDSHGNVQAEWALGDIDDPTDDRAAVNAFATPTAGAPNNFFARPVATQESSVTTPPVVLSESAFVYDGLPAGQVSRGNVTSSLSFLVDPVNGLDAAVAVSRSYPVGNANAGLPEQVSDPFVVGQETPRFSTYGYDPQRAFVTTTTRGGLTKTSLYDPAGAPPGLGVVKQIRDENDAMVDFTADVFGRMTSRSGPTPLIGTSESRVYDDFAGFDPTRARFTVTQADGNGNSVAIRSFTDGLGREIRTQRDGLDANDMPATIVQRTAFDALGRVGFTSRPAFGSASAVGTQILYDARGRVRFIVQADGGVNETRYDGLFEINFDGEGRRTDTKSNGVGSVVQVTEYPDTTARTTRYVYDPLGRLRLMCDALATGCSFQAGPTGLPIPIDPRHAIEIDYDTLGRRVRVVDPDLGDWRYRYDGSGNLVVRTDARGRTARYAFDAVFGRRKSEDWNGDGAPEVVLTYGDELASPPANSRGRLVSSAEPALSSSYVYDATGRTTAATTQFVDDGGPYTVQNGYDWLDRVMSTTYPDGEVVTRQYDRMGIDRVASSARIYVSDVRHNADGYSTRLDYGNGNIRELTYFPASGYLQSLTGRPGSGSSFLARTYTHDYTARVKSIADAIEPAESLSGNVYDGVGRLTQTTRGGTESLMYGYDAIGNLLSKEGAAQPFDHPSKPHALFDASNPSRFSYDANGNLVRRSGATLAYDSLNRLEWVSGPLFSRFAYARSGERVRKQRGADVSRFLGPDLELQNGVRWAKTIRVEGMAVAQVSIGPGPGGAASPGLGYGETLDPEALSMVLVALVLLGTSAGLFARRGPGAAWQRGVAAGLCVAVVIVPAYPVLANAPGDVRVDSLLDVADALLLERALQDEIMLTPEQQVAADVAPFANGEAVGDGTLDSADLLLLLRGVRDEDVDGDGLVGSTDPVPLSFANDLYTDADQDGLEDAAEQAIGTNPALADSDGDGLVDSQDGAPLVAAGTQVLFVHSDHLGGSAVLTDASGNVVRRLRYGVFGESRANERVGPPSTLDPAQKYTGQRLDDDTGLVYYGARYYDPTTGRFTSPDPLVQNVLRPQRLNRYSYVDNDPLSRIDPSGNYSLSGVVSDVVDFFSSAGRAISNYVLDPIVNFGSGLANGFGGGSGGGGRAYAAGSSLGGAIGSAAQRGAFAVAAPFQAAGSMIGAAIGGSSQSGVTSSPSAGITGVLGAIGNGIRGLGGILADDLGSAFTGLVATPYGLGKGLVTALYGIATLNPQTIGRGLSDFGWALVPRYGFFSGPGWGRPTGLGYGPFNNPIDRGAVPHDRDATQPGADRQLIRDVWSSHALGPYGQLYRIGLTLGFGAGIALGFDD